MKNKKNSSDRFADAELIKASLSGDKSSLENLIKKHQDWIYNVSLSFVGDPEQAADLSQEVLIKMVTKLSTFKMESNFRTWLYRVIKNHFLNMARKKFEGTMPTFDEFGDGLDNIADESLTSYSFEVEQKLLVEEAKLSCMKGMLLCLDREQRLIFIMGEIFEFTDAIGAEIMGISKQNFRVRLHRARQQLYNFMGNKCGLINKNNPCRCARKTAGFIKMGFVDPDNLHFQKDTISEINRVVEKRLKDFDNDVFAEYQQLYQKHPFLKSPESIESIRKLMSSESIKRTFNFD